MNFTRLQIAAASLLVNVIVPSAVIAADFFLLKNRNPFPGCLVLALIAYLQFRVNPWEFSWYYLRYVYLALVLMASILGMGRTERFAVDGFRLAELAISAVLTVLLSRISLGSRYPRDGLRLSFPFRSGRYLITDGGDGTCSSMLNYHYRASIHTKGSTNASMKFAVDIVKLDRSGCTARNLLSARNESYPIFGEILYSPCDGQVLNIVDSEQNNLPFSRNYPYSAGNRIEISVADRYIVLLGHLQKGSILVSKGDRVTAGQELARVGNSGLSPRPHLHLQASRFGKNLWAEEGIPVVFGNRWNPLKNSYRVF